MPKRTNSDEEENVASDSSSDQNNSDSEQEEIVEQSSSKKKAKVDSDSNESDNKSNRSSSDESSEEDEKRKDAEEEDAEEDKKIAKKSSTKSNPIISSDEDEDDKSEDEKSKKSNKSDDDSEKEKSNKSNDEKSDKSDDDEESFFSSKKKVRKIMDSDSDSSRDSDHRKDEKRIKKERTNDDIENIFGEMSDEDEPNKDAVKREKSENEEPDSDREIERELDKENETEEIRDIFQQFEDEDDEQQPETETRIDVEIPKITTDLGKESHFVKLPNFLSVDTHPYDPSWYEDEIDEDEIHDDEGRARMKLKVENTIRWRNVVDKDGNMTKESNARIVKWSDGSMSLHLGSEIFDIHKQHLLQGDNNHLYIRQGTGLQGQSVFKTKLTFRPHSTDSFTHKKMTLSLADRSQKTQKIRVLPTVGEDPEANRTDRIKKEEDKLRASLRRENKARRVRERVNQRGPTASYLEPDLDDDDEGAISLSAIKNKYKQRGSNYADVYSDSESSRSSNDSIFNKKKATATKKTGKIEESDDED